MKKPNINKLMKKMGIPREHKFIGYILFNVENDDFLACGSGESEISFSFLWVASPMHAKIFTSYNLAINTVTRLELSNRVVVMMAFDLGSQIGVVELPSTH